MLQIIRSMRDLNFRSLTGVYRNNEEVLGGCNLSAKKQLDAEQDFYLYLKDVFFRTNCACYAVWEQDGLYLAALRLEPYRDGMLITALETAPEVRGKGIATALLSAVLSEFSSRIIYSHVRKDNSSSLRVHEKCGFFRISDFATMLNGSVSFSYWTLCFGI